MYCRSTASHHTEVPECVWADVRAAPGDGESQSFTAEELDGAQDDAASGFQERRQTTRQGKVSQT
jgi:hypothetical protein